jgi:hypothetical protein
VQKAAECGLTSSNHPHWIPVQNSTLHKSLWPAYCCEGAEKQLRINVKKNCTTKVSK